MSGSAARLALAQRAAAACGVTRLADITYLDVLGVPVFQAIRPFSRALSVHQGKGFTADDAKLGALMEAVESHCAESYRGHPVVRPFADLSPAARAPTLADFASERRQAPGVEEPLAWVQARRVTDDGPLWVPLDVVSLDFSRRGDPRLDRSSNGLGCHFEPDAALATALLELVERDAFATFMAWSPVHRAAARFDADALPSAWMQALKVRLDEASVVMNVYAPPAVIAASVFVCELLELADPGALRSRVFGSACHPDPETALRKAVLEAAQSRLTMISGVRDDLPDRGQPHVGGAALGFAFPPPPGMGLPRSRRAGQPHPWPPNPWPPTARQIALRLEQAGFGPCASVDLSPADAGVYVYKAVAPGLGGNARTRRPMRPLDG